MSAYRWHLIFHMRDGTSSRSFYTTREQAENSVSAFQNGGDAATIPTNVDNIARYEISEAPADFDLIAYLEG